MPRLGVFLSDEKHEILGVNSMSKNGLFLLEIEALKI
tara:strand:- start:63 stop:173 length:111 start_codon:yes stop_codon:yes gene_type:complete